METPAAIGRYPIERSLGAGAFARVWLGHDDRLDSYVAIKVLADNWAAESEVRERFLKEARLLRRADSQRIVQVHDIGELPDGRPYFVMTYADMGTLSGLLVDGPLPVAEALELIGEVAEGVEVLHRLGIVHRDIKPSNVLFRSTPGGGRRLMVADLGVARSLADATSHTIAAGSPGYMAPEQMRLDGAPDERADVHGLGAMAYHLLTGQVPAQGAVRLAPHALRAGVPGAVSAAVMKAIDPDPSRRWQSVSAFVTALNEPSVASDLGTPSAPGASSGPDASSSSGASPFVGRRKALLTGGAALVVAGAAVAGVLALRPTGGSSSTPDPAPSATSTGALLLRDHPDIPRQYREMIIQAGRRCQLKGLSPALIAAMLKVESGFDPHLSDPDKDEYGIARWTPRVLRVWQPDGVNRPEPKPEAITPELSIPAMGVFLCNLGPNIEDLPGDPAEKLVALYRSGVQPMKAANGIPAQWKTHIAQVMKYRSEYQP
ncbi:serine/threonine-protein kinase [Nonomuraea sp. NPDC050556]|uniref:serine/threonine-protein kinase n=1 Tax=Nonomuraea sp. NPDC050556 TaxID=3364369 RepID=UPI0037A92950